MDGIKRNVPTITKATHGTNIKTKSKRIPKTDATREIVAPFPVVCVLRYIVCAPGHLWEGSLWIRILFYHLFYQWHFGGNSLSL